MAKSSSERRDSVALPPPLPAISHRSAHAAPPIGSPTGLVSSTLVQNSIKAQPSYPPNRNALRRLPAPTFPDRPTISRH